MAKLNSDTIEIKVSELVKDDAPNAVILDADLLTQILEVVEQLVGDKRLVEINLK